MDSWDTSSDESYDYDQMMELGFVFGESSDGTLQDIKPIVPYGTEDIVKSWYCPISTCVP